MEEYAIDPQSKLWTQLFDPDTILDPKRLEAMPASRFSSGRTLLEKMQREEWTITRELFTVDERGEGNAVYRVEAPGEWIFDFVCFSFEPDKSSRSGRITEPNWDMMGALIEGPTSEEDRQITKQEIPKLYAGRAVPNTLTWARSNRSFRAFNSTVAALASGQQPEIQDLWEIGYLMRNTGLDGNGTFLTRSFLTLESDHPLRFPLHAQLLSAYIMREFSCDLAEGIAQQQSSDAVSLSPEIRRMVALGNGSALGLLYFVNTHPLLFNQWLSQRQTMIYEAAQLPLTSGSSAASEIEKLLKRAHAFYDADPYVYNHFEDPHRIAKEILEVSAVLEQQLKSGTTGAELLDALQGDIGVETWELVASLLLELLPYERIEAALESTICAEYMIADATMPLSELKMLLHRDYRWALEADMRAEGARRFVWYKSQNAEEPRRGPVTELGGVRNWALDLPTETQRLRDALEQHSDLIYVGELLRERPELRATIERIQSLKDTRYHSPHMNMLGTDLVPVSIVRHMNASVHGLLRTVDEGDDRNVLGLIYLGAPTAADLNAQRSLETRFPMQPTIG